MLASGLCWSARISRWSLSNIYDAAGEFLARVDFRLKDCTYRLRRAREVLAGGRHRADHWLEKKRHEALLDAGYEVVRVTWSDLAAPHRIVDRVRAAAARAAKRG